MYQLRSANQRGQTLLDWLDSRHSFSFGDYYDPAFMGFSDLRVINDDVVSAKQGFAPHSHKNMEIVTIPLSGRLQHRDSMGNGSVIRAGDVQKMSAGSGILHSEMNPSASQAVHFLQIWLIPNIRDTQPDYQQKRFAPEQMTDQLALIVSPDGREESIIIRQDAEIYQCLLNVDKEVSFSISDDRKVWIQAAEGSISVNGRIMVAGDGLAISDENVTIFIRGIDKRSNFLLFNLRK